jgi:prepilin-type N-terminal cleavage/methylation domain-containing protein
MSKKLMNDLFKKKNTGFTLLETLIAIAILTLAIGAAFGVAQKSLSAAYTSKNQTSAAFLAAEGIELVRTVRDSVSLYNNIHPTDPKNWLQPFKDACNVDADILLTSACVFAIAPDSTGLFYDNFGTFADPSAIMTPSTPSMQNSQDYVSDKGFLLHLTNQYNVNYFTSGALAAGYPASIFYRTITISETVNGNKKEAVVTSSVKWLNQPAFVISETLTNWQ